MALDPARVLIIDDELELCMGAARVLRGEGHEVEHHQDPVEGLARAMDQGWDVILLDIRMPRMDGLEVLASLRAHGVRAEVVMISGHATVETAVEAMKRGAVDLLPKPFTPTQLRLVMHRVMHRSALVQENLTLRRELEGRGGGFQGMVGRSRAMERVFSVLQRVAPTDGTVLLYGESGTGKELAARAIHELSERRRRPFVACDPSALAPGVVESELFGHARGAFTGAVSAKQGLFQAADGGTLFLDEIANLSLELQGKLLRVLESRRVRGVGENVDREVDIRLVAATNRDLADEVAAGRFREDLRYRLEVVPITLPPLRERDGDVPLLAQGFLEAYRQRNPASAGLRFSPEALELLELGAWPGNVRELRNIVERVAILCDAQVIAPRHLPSQLREAPPRLDRPPVPFTWAECLQQRDTVARAAGQRVERRFVEALLERCEDNVSRAAREAGMSRTQLHGVLKRHGLRG
jgi:DNA-binding NtrC family response regulator